MASPPAKSPLQPAWAIEFDFETRTERKIPCADAPGACAAGKFCWIDLDSQADSAMTADVLRKMGVNEHAIAEAIGPDVDGRHDLYDDCLHIAITSGSLIGPIFTSSHVDVVIGERFLATLRRGHVEFIEQVRRHYRQDFIRFARSPSFLIYEYFDYLIESYKQTMLAFEGRVERIQTEIFGSMDDSIFNEVSTTTRDLLSFRKIMVAAREVLHELSSRRSPFISESAQPFLERMVGTLERLSSDLSVAREILAETLNLYMGIVSHRTNKIVNRLTVLSMIFLPLTFLSSIYGMNFGEEQMPEFRWPYSYLAFWILVVFIGLGLMYYMKRMKWI
jgi:magnesium transporter